MSQGFVLNIPMEMLKRLDAADDKINNIAETSEQASKRIIAAFQQMNANGVQAFIKGLNEAQMALSNIKNGASNNPLGGIATNAIQSADAVNTLVASIAKLYAENNKLRNQQLSARGITIAQENQLSQKQAAVQAKELLNNERELMNAQRERERELMRADKQSAKRHAEQMARYKQEIQELTRFARTYAQIPKALSTTDVGKLIARSLQSGKSINQSIVAIKNLEKAKKDLDTTDSRYSQTLAKIDSEIKRHKENLRKLGVETSNAEAAHRSLLNTADQLKRAVALTFSISAIKGYVSEIAKWHCNIVELNLHVF